MIADSPLVHDVVPSPNHGERREGKRPDILLLHYTGMAASATASACKRAVAWLCAPESQVSCHYVVDVDGRILQLVPEARRAWHAGRAFWAGETDVNSRSIGVEIVNPGHEFGYPDFPEPQIAALIRLARDICGRWDIPPERVLGHSDVAPARKADPGEKFPWPRLAAMGLARPTPGMAREAPIFESSAGQGSAAPPRHRPGDFGPDVAALQSRMRRIGYGVVITGRYDGQTEAAVRAFQRRWRPDAVTGIADRRTAAMIRALSSADRSARAVAG